MKTAEERKKMTMQQAMKWPTPLFVTECCGGCGKEGGRLYVISYDHMYAGNSYCRSCFLETVNDQELVGDAE